MPIHTSLFFAPILVDYLSNFPDSRMDFRTEERAIGSDHDNFDVKISCGPSEGLDQTACHTAAWRYTLCRSTPRISTGQACLSTLLNWGIITASDASIAIYRTIGSSRAL
jgi:hypothetical protein